MDWLAVQTLDGMDWAQQNLPNFSSPVKMWDWFKMRTVFVFDPDEEELLQTLPTMMENNVHGIPGAGDCDCFAIALATAMTEQGWPNEIILAGNSKRYPVHIYNVVWWEGERYVMDLANPYFDQERDRYKYYQDIPVNL